MKKSGKKTILLCSMFLLLSLSAAGQEIELQAANFSSGVFGSKNYEHLTFYVVNGRREKILYSHGRSGRAKEIELTNLGVETKGGRKSLKVRFPNNLILLITPLGNTLRVTNEKGDYRKVFSWEYEGPVDGRGTWCDSCTQNGRESVKLVKTYFLK